MVKKKQSEAKGNKKFWRRVIITGLAASVLVVLANSAFWVNRYIFDTNNFTSVAVGAVTSESSRQAIAGEVVDAALKDRPIVKQLAAPTATRGLTQNPGPAARPAAQAAPQ